MRKYQRALTDREVSLVKFNIECADHDVQALVETINTVFTMVSGETFKLEDSKETVDPTDYAIPDHQWEEICEALMACTDDRIGIGMAWMNSGPSAYTPQEV